MNQKVTIRLSDSLLAMLDVQATGEHRSMSNLIRKILCDHTGMPYAEDLDKTANPELPLS
jgi:Arc/MetJ-type ribon-helix-helix transcriptional regulator